MASSTVAANARNAARKRAELESDYKLATSRTKADYGITKGALDRALKSNLGETRGDYASKGLYNSSIRTGEEADLGTAYTSDINNANMALQRELENLSRARTKGILGITTGLESGLFQSTGESLASVLQRALNSARSANRPM